MPDEKLSAQLEHTSAVIGTDILSLLSGSTPANYRVQVKNFLSQVQITLPSTDFSAMKVTASIAAAANAATQAAGDFTLIANNALTAIAGGLNRYGLKGAYIDQTGNCAITGQVAAAIFTLDTGNSATVNSNTFGVIVRHFANTRPRHTHPQAFFGVFEDANTGGAETLYVMELGAGGKHVSGVLANTDSGAIFSQGTMTASHTLKIRVNGTDLWVLCSNIAP